jgi:hypothetical protein
MWTPVFFRVVQALDVVVLGSDTARSPIPRRAVFVEVFEDIEMAVSGSKCTQKHINWTILLHAILYDVRPNHQLQDEAYNFT